MKILNKQNIKGYSSRDWFVAALLFGSIISFCAIMVASSATEYNNSDIVDENFESKYSKVEGFNEEINKSLAAVQEDPGIVGVATLLFKASFAFINFLLNTLGLISEPTLSFTEDFDVPLQVSSIIFTVALAIITITLVLRILSVVTQRKF